MMTVIRTQRRVTSTKRAPPVPRRYSEFVFLWDCLVKRYPFRLLPSLPPKRIGRKALLFDLKLRELIVPDSRRGIP